MRECEQTKGQSVLGHGESVYRHVSELMEKPVEALADWRLPEWFVKNRDLILASIHDTVTMKLYTVYHDCGKPRCRTVDEQGKVHFPDHAKVSEQVFREHFDNEAAAKLVGWDMVIHTASADEIDRLLKNEFTIHDAFTLCLVALSELHSNAKMFGGIESDSFKSKWKKSDQRGKQICKYYFG